MTFRVVRVRMEYMVHVPDSIPGDPVQVAIDAEIPFTLVVLTTGEIVEVTDAAPRGAFVVGSRQPRRG